MSTRSPRILIVRLSAIGDVMHAVPVANALRDAFPRAYLAWIVEGRTAELLRGHRALNDVIALPRGWLKSPRGVLALRRRLRGLRFDTAIDLQGLSKSAIAAWLSGARRRISLASSREISPWLNNELVEPTRTHITERSLELLAPLGITHPSVRFGLVENPADALTASQILESQKLLRSFALVNPGASWPSKRWPIERFSAVACHLGQSRGLRSLVVWAGEEERRWAEQIVADSTGQAVIAPATSLGELAALARRAAIFIGSDTGPLHVAAAVGTPCIGLFGPMPGERNGPYGPQHVIVQKVWLTGRGRDRRRAGPESMEAISIEDVVRACERILERDGRGRRSA